MSPANIFDTMLSAVLLVALVTSSYGRPNLEDIYEDDVHMHPAMEDFIGSIKMRDGENEADFWNEQAQQTMHKKLQQRHNTNVAKNVIMFLGDGMSIPTHKAARIYMGQILNEGGEESSLSFENFPYVGLSKTYCLNTQVPDSACTATAYLCGIKANHGTVGVTGNVPRNNCTSSLNEFVSALYAHSAARGWESDGDEVPAGCDDIATQLIHGETGKKFNVILGCGRREFRPTTVRDEEGTRGRRLEGDLIEDWLDLKNGQNAEYVWNRTALLDVPDETDYLLGLFEGSHCQYHMDADDREPTLEEMTVAAIKILSKSENGYFLFVEGGRIDHAHHSNRAQKALDETLEFSKAIQKAYDMTDEEETLIVVTADHAHVMTVNGYPSRGDDILGVATRGSDGIPIGTLLYTNGPGHRPDIDGVRHDITQDDTHHPEYRFPSLAPLSSETHGGDEVGIFASGPWSHLFVGVLEQNVIPHMMAYASCVGSGSTACYQDT